MIEVHAHALNDTFCTREADLNGNDVLNLFRHFEDNGISTIATDVNRSSPLRNYMFAGSHSKPNTLVYESWRLAQLDVLILYYHKDDQNDNGYCPQFGALLPVCDFEFGPAIGGILQTGYNDLLKQEKYLQNLFDDIETTVTAERRTSEAKGEGYQPLGVYYGELLPKEFKKPRVELKGMLCKNPDKWWNAFSDYREYDEAMAELKSQRQPQRGREE